MVLDELLDELSKTDLPYALFDSFIRVLNERIKDLQVDILDYEENYPDTSAVNDKIASDTEQLIRDSKLFLQAWTKKIE